MELISKMQDTQQALHCDEDNIEGDCSASISIREDESSHELNIRDKEEPSVVEDTIPAEDEGISKVVA